MEKNLKREYMYTYIYMNQFAIHLKLTWHCKSIRFQYGSVGKESAHNAGNRRFRFDPWVRKIPWRRKWQLTPVFLPEKSHGQRRLAVYSPKGQKELDTTEPLSMHAKFFKRVNCVICELNVNKAAINCTNFKTKMLYNIMHVICNFLKMYRIRKKTRMKKEL